RWHPLSAAFLHHAPEPGYEKSGNLFLRAEEAFSLVAMKNAPPAFAEVRKREPLVHPRPGTVLGRLIRSNTVVHIPDVMLEPAYVEREPMFVTAVELGDFRAELGVPMLNDGALSGPVMICGQEAGPC